ncbi:hypothetical protein D3C83_247010 [compost metagenome]
MRAEIALHIDDEKRAARHVEGEGARRRVDGELGHIGSAYFAGILTERSRNWLV